jgi:septal ring factor EnvC (AmiA/AmiB activator)
LDLKERGNLVDKVLDILGAAGYPSGFAGVVLMLLFYLRKQESGIRADINGSIQRLQAEKADLEAKLDARDEEIDLTRKERRDAEDREDKQRRRADALQARLETLQSRLDQLESGQPWQTKG